MDVSKQQWSEEETSCLLAVWSSAEVQDKLDGASRTKPVFFQIQREMAAAGYDRTIVQISNKLKKLKKEYRDQKKDISRIGRGKPKRNPHFEILDSVLGDRLVCKATGALNSATAMLEVMKDDTVTLPQPGPELSAIKQEEANLELMSPLECSSPTPSSSWGESRQTRQGKRKRNINSNAELLEYLERSDERFLQHSKDLNDALLQKMETDNNAFLGLMGRMVSLLEAQAHK